MSDSIFSDNASNGLDIEPQSSGGVSAAITRSGFYHNANINFFVYGANGTGAINVAVTDSVAANGNSFNGDIGFDVESGSSCHQPLADPLPRRWQLNWCGGGLVTRNALAGTNDGDGKRTGL